MPFSHALYVFADDSLLAKEERIHRLKYRLLAMIASHLFWSVIHLVFDWTKTKVMHPHIAVATIGGLSYYTGELCKVDLLLLQLRKEIGVRPRLVRRQLTSRDYVEVVAAGMSMALGICGVVEVFDCALGVHNPGVK